MQVQVQAQAQVGGIDSYLLEKRKAEFCQA